MIFRFISDQIIYWKWIRSFTISMSKRISWSMLWGWCIINMPKINIHIDKNFSNKSNVLEFHILEIIPIKTNSGYKTREPYPCIALVSIFVNCDNERAWTMLVFYSQNLSIIYVKIESEATSNSIGKVYLTRSIYRNFKFLVVLS
jgi:hypothetical protein